MTAALRPEAERLVEDQWRQKKNDPAAVAEVRRADPALSEPVQRNVGRSDSMRAGLIWSDGNSSGRWSASFLARCSGSGRSPGSICAAWPRQSEASSWCC